MQLEPCVLLTCWLSPSKLLGVWLVDIVVLPVGLQTHSVHSVLSLIPPLGTPCSLQWLAESICLYIVRLWESLSADRYIRFLSERASCIYNSIWVWCLYMGWIPRWDSLWMAFPSVTAPYFVFVFPQVSILFPLLRRTEASTLWSSFFLSFMWFVNCILSIPSFWANIHNQ